MEHRDRCSIQMVTALYGTQGQMQHTDGHCTPWNTGTDAAYRWSLYCMEHRDISSIQMVTVLYGTHAHRPLSNSAMFSCRIIIQFCSQLTTALFGGATIFHTAIIFRTRPLPTRPSHDLMQWRVTYFSSILRHTQGLSS